MRLGAKSSNISTKTPENVAKVCWRGFAFPCACAPCADLAYAVAGLSQVRNVEEVSACSVVGIIGMVVSLVVIALKLCITPVTDTYAPTEIVHRQGAHRSPNPVGQMLSGAARVSPACLPIFDARAPVACSTQVTVLSASGLRLYAQAECALSQSCSCSAIVCSMPCTPEPDMK